MFEVFEMFEIEIVGESVRFANCFESFVGTNGEEIGEKILAVQHDWHSWNGNNYDRALSCSPPHSCSAMREIEKAGMRVFLKMLHSSLNKRMFEILDRTVPLINNIQSQIHI
jgi:hypothetical protein